MNDDVLLRFVEKNLIHVGGDDTKLERLGQAAGDLSEILKGTPQKTLAFSLVAFDPQVPEKDPVIAEAGDALGKRWATYVNTFPSPPVAVFRAMLTSALIHAARDNEAIASAFAACARNALPFMEAGGEREIWADVVAEVEREVEERAEAQWAAPASIILPKTNLDDISLDDSAHDKKVDRSMLTRQLRAAAGPHFIDPKDGQQRATKGNQHYPHDNENWIYEFGTRAAGAVADAIEGTTESLSAEKAELSKATRNLAAAMSAHLEKTIQMVSDAAAGVQQRAGLLWWKEALFSPTARKSYRDMPESTAAALMAFDLHQQLPAFSPSSVAAFLRETVIALPNIDGDQKRTVRELVEDAGRTCFLSDLRTEAARLVPAAPVGRAPLIGLIGHPEVPLHANEKRFRDLAGVKPDTHLSLPDWSVWLLREFQAGRTVFEASTPKRKTTSRRRTPRT